MPPRTRRQVLAGLASGLTVGCTSREAPSVSTVTPYDVPTINDETPVSGDDFRQWGFRVEGTAALPADVPGVPSTRATRLLSKYEGWTITNAVAHGDHVDVLVVDGDATPRLLRLNDSGSTVADRRLEAVESPTPSLLTRIGDTTVVGGQTAVGDRRQTWLRGYEEGKQTTTFVTDGPGSVEFSALDTLGGSLVAGGTVYGDPNTRGRTDGVLARIDTTGALRWEERYNETGRGTSVKTIVSANGGVFGGGVRANQPWLVTATLEGQRAWDRDFTSGTNAYSIAAVAMGSAGPYVLANSLAITGGPRHVLVESLDRTGTVAWRRVFDLGSTDDAGRGLVGTGIVDDAGPVLVGLRDGGQRWLASLDPDGSVAWAGFEQSGIGALPIEESVPTPGLTAVDRPIVYGVSETDDGAVAPWLVWL